MSDIGPVVNELIDAYSFREREYIDICNMTRLKAIDYLIRECIFMSDEDKDRSTELKIIINLLIDSANIRMQPLKEQ